MDMISGYLANKAIDTGVKVGQNAIKANLDPMSQEEPSDHDLLKEAVRLLSQIANANSPEETPNQNQNVVLHQYPAQWEVPNYQRAHLCLFTPVPINTIRFDFPTMATYQPASFAAGWHQLDLEPGTQLSVTDANNYTVLLSYRDDAIGVSL